MTKCKQLTYWISVLCLCAACGDDAAPSQAAYTPDASQGGHDAGSDIDASQSSLDASRGIDSSAQPGPGAPDTGTPVDAAAHTPVPAAPDTGVAIDATTQGGPDLTALPRTDFEAAEAIAARGRSCGFISEGTWGAEFYPGTFCASLCFLQATCTDFERTVCTTDVVTGPLDTCLSACDQSLGADAQPVAQCGDGQVVAYELLCDLKNDCATGEDEKHCVFTCADGQKASGLSVCDGWPDCDDGSDEQGCATLCGQPRVDPFKQH